jgi:hypothetical protein
MRTNGLIIADRRDEQLSIFAEEEEQEEQEDCDDARRVELAIAVLVLMLPCV